MTALKQFASVATKSARQGTFLPDKGFFLFLDLFIYWKSNGCNFYFIFK